MHEHWSQYWQQGHLTSFSLDIKENYQGRLFQLWSEFFHGCRAGTNVLDIGTGNGALIDIATSVNSTLDLYGIDYAELNVPKNLIEKNNIYIKQRVDAENLPFSMQSFDYVISQFGIEYADLSRALSELNRVLKVDGVFQLVVHDVSSSIVKPNTNILSAAKALLKYDGALYHLDKLFIALSDSGKHSREAEACRIDLNLSVGDIAKYNEEGLFGTNFPAFLKMVMSPTLSFSQRQEKLILFKYELKGQVERLSELLNAAFNKQKYYACKEILASLELTVLDDYMLYENEMAIARVINGRK